MKRGDHGPMELTGLAVSPGVAIGRAVRISDENPEVLRFQLDRDEIDGELDRFRQGRSSALEELARVQERLEKEVSGDLAGILEAQAMLLSDPGFVHRVEAVIVDRQVNAEWAVLESCEELGERFARIEGEYLRERGEDLRSVSRYLLRSLRGIAYHDISEIEGDVIIVADELTPADALRLARQQVVGFALESGGRTSHTAIIARGLNLPAVFGIEGVSRAVGDKAAMVLDGNEGRVILHPTEETLEAYEAQRREARGREAELTERALAPRTADGVDIELLANLELLDEIGDAQRFGAAGVGLFRSEFFYIEKSPDLPTEEEHYQLIAELLRALSPGPVTVRTLDLGGKDLAHQLLPDAEENPVLGLRGIRLHLVRPDILRVQIRALLRAAVHGDLRIMIPLVTSLDESRAFQQLCAEVASELATEGVAHRSDIPLGAMVEVPATAMIVDGFARELDFLSIGTNDLIQYALAVDRNNEHVANLYRPDHPAVLRLLHRIAVDALAVDCELSICGEVAADPVLTPFLLGIGLRQLSMSPRSIPQIKARLAGLRTADLDETVDGALKLATADDVRDYLLARHPLP